MSKLGRIVLYGLLAVLVLATVGITFTIGWRPFIGPRMRPVTARSFERTPERVARGQYIFASHACLDCHGQHDPQNPESFLLDSQPAGEIMPIETLPGRVVAPNLTADPETGLGRWTDDEISRAIREGVDRNGRALFPMMPYPGYHSMSDEDVASLVVYLRTLPAVKHELPATKLNFPVNYLINNAPEPVTSPVAGPDPHDQVAVGKYLVTTTACPECHTPSARGKDIAGMGLAGGVSFTAGSMRAASSNITPDPSGINYYDEALFVQVMRTGLVRGRKLDPMMPYRYFKNFTDDDLKAMFAYVRTVPPVKHRVDNSLPVTECKLCRQKHGAGDQN